MRVDFNAGSAIPENTVSTSSSARAPETASSAGNEETTRFSSGEAGVSTLAAVALHAPEVRQAKVEALRQQIAAGSYQVSPHQIAASIFDQLRTSQLRASKKTGS